MGAEDALAKYDSTSEKAVLAVDAAAYVSGVASKTAPINF